jgi:hypothetical protein
MDLVSVPEQPLVSKVCMELCSSLAKGHDSAHNLGAWWRLDEVSLRLSAC